jgi:hypothetical protein
MLISSTTKSFAPRARHFAITQLPAPATTQARFPQPTLSPQNIFRALAGGVCVRWRALPRAALLVLPRLGQRQIFGARQLVSLPKAPAPGSAVWVGVGVAVSVGAGVAVSAAAATAVSGPGVRVAAAVAVAASVRVAAGVSVGVAVSAASALAAGCAAAACCNKSTAARKAAKPTRKFLPTKLCPSATSSKHGCKNTRSPALPARLLHNYP